HVGVRLAWGSASRLANEARAVAPESRDVDRRFAAVGERREQLAEHGAELEAVSRCAGTDHHIADAVDDEVLAARVVVQARVDLHGLRLERREPVASRGLERFDSAGYRSEVVGLRVDDGSVVMKGDLVEVGSRSREAIDGWYAMVDEDRQPGCGRFARTHVRDMFE